MDWKGLSKQQKQVVFLIGIVLSAAIYGVHTFALKPLMENWKQSSAELSDLQTKLHKANLAIRSERKLRRELMDSEKELKTAVAEFIPSKDDPYAWVSAKIYALAREAGIRLESVEETSTIDLHLAADEENGPAFDNYAVRITTYCSYAKVIAFLRVIENSNPYIVVAGLTIVGVPSNVERHSIALIVEWPMWMRSAGPESIRSLEEHEPKTTEATQDAS